MSGAHVDLERTFVELPNYQEFDPSRPRPMWVGRGAQCNWDMLLESHRVLIVSEAGMGKTAECKRQQKRLWAAGESSFHIELSVLATSSLESQLTPEEKSRFESWHDAQSETATFFLDSIDELKLTPNSFEFAIRAVANSIGPQNLHRAKITLTTRPIPMDQYIIEKYLPLPAVENVNVVAREEYFVGAAVNIGESKQNNAEPPTVPKWRSVALSPLNESQRRSLALRCGVQNVDDLLAAVEIHNAHEFTERPLDFIELCGDWKERGQIRPHRQQVEAAIETKLRPRTERTERVQLDARRARQGAERLAFAALMTRRFTIWYSSENDRSSGDSALEPARILDDFNEDEIRTLLERPLFGFATYGRVRFHHRSVIEFLAAERLLHLDNLGMSTRTLSRLLFTTTTVGTRVVKPSMRSVAAWMAPFNSSVREEILDRDPSILLQFADPAALRVEDRDRALRLYVRRYGAGQWRGQPIPPLQIQRFANPNLALTVSALWTSSVSNPEVQETLLRLIGAGRLIQCADLAFKVATAKRMSVRTRFHALGALSDLDDVRTHRLLSEMATKPASWPLDLLAAAVTHLFPHDMSVPQLISALRRLAGQQERVSSFSYMLPSIIERGQLSGSDITALREGLADVIASTTSWNKARYSLVTSQEELVPALLATCRLEREACINSDAWVDATALALCLAHSDVRAREQREKLQESLASANSVMRGRFFWATDRLLFAHEGEAQEAGMRLGRVESQYWLDLVWNIDGLWLRSVLANTSAAMKDRELVLLACLRMLRWAEGGLQQLKALRPDVADEPRLDTFLTGAIDQIENPSPEPKWMRADIHRHEQAQQNREERFASWGQFWRYIVADPDQAFAPSEQQATAWNLWSVMKKMGGSGSGWNRGFIERAFSPEIADRLREALRHYWRNDRPSVPTERAASDRDSYKIIWTMGLAGIYAEAESRGWAAQLNECEAELAARYALLEANSLPAWLDDLIDAHSTIVESLIGSELSAELSNISVEYSMLLQNIRNSSPRVIKLVLPRVRAWFRTEIASRGRAKVSTDKLDPVVRLILDHGTEEDRRVLVKQAMAKLKGSPPADITKFWLPVLFQLDPDKGLDVLDRLAAAISVQRVSPVTAWIANLFSRLISNRSVRLTVLEHHPKLVLRAARIACHHVRFADDKSHDGPYSPDTRDNAEEARSALINMLLNARGTDAWHAKVAFADLPDVASFRDRTLAIADQTLAEDCDSPPMEERDVLVFEQRYEFPPANRADMATLLHDRLADIVDLLRSDVSPRELWSKIKIEREMRREVSRTLLDIAHDAYTVNQEAVTGDEKETDIRLISTRGPLEAVIELKLAEQNYSVSDFELALRKQLVERYLVPEYRRVGCLLISIAKDRTWKHPQTGKKLSVDQLFAHLNALATTLAASLGYDAYLTVMALDLRPRNLTSARSARSETRRGKSPAPAKRGRLAAPKQINERAGISKGKNKAATKSTTVQKRSRGLSGLVTKRKVSPSLT